MARRSWKNKTVEDFIDYYQTNYADMSRSEVYEADSGFYQAVRKRKLQDQVFPGSLNANNRDWSEFGLDNVEDFIDYYQTNYADMSRSEVYEADSGFYQAVRKRKLQDQVFPESLNANNRDWSEFGLDNFIDYYNEHHNGRSRKEVEKADRGFYQAVRKRKLQDQVFPEKLRNWNKFKVEDFQNYYQTNYPGKSRGEIFKADPGFHQAIYKRKLQDQVFSESVQSHYKRRGYWKDFDNIKKPLEELIETLGRFPKKGEIEKKNKSLSEAIRTHHKGYISVKNQMGYFEREKELARILIGLF